MYTACRLSKAKEGALKSKSGFPTKEEAMKYIEGAICTHCVGAMKEGHILAGNSQREINNVLDTTCGCEWLVIEDKDFEKAEGFTDLLTAAGYTVREKNGGGSATKD